MSILTFVFDVNLRSIIGFGVAVGEFCFLFA